MKRGSASPSSAARSRLWISPYWATMVWTDLILLAVCVELVIIEQCPQCRQMLRDVEVEAPFTVVIREDQRLDRWRDAGKPTRERRHGLSHCSRNVLRRAEAGCPAAACDHHGYPCPPAAGCDRAVGLPVDLVGGGRRALRGARPGRLVRRVHLGAHRRAGYTADCARRDGDGCMER